MSITGVRVHSCIIFWKEQRIAICLNNHQIENVSRRGLDWTEIFETTSRIFLLR